MNSPKDHVAETAPQDDEDYHVSALGEIWVFLRVRKKFWLAPIIITLLLLGLLILAASSAGVVSPFIYMM
ncbi:MAG: DUF5989 family protein [Candidatus Hydrogenedentales bacterium]